MGHLSMVAALRELLSNVSPEGRRQLVPVMLLMLLGAAAELISIGALLPFLALIGDPAAASSGPLSPLVEVLNLTEPSELILCAAIAFSLAAMIAGGLRLLLVWVSQRFVFGIAHELSTAAYARVLQQDYAWHSVHNSAETLAAINKAQMVTAGLLVPLMQAASASVIALFILVGLLVVDPVVALSAGAGFGAVYLAVMQLTRRKMRDNGSIIARSQRERVQVASEGLGGIRDILLDRSQPIFITRFDKVEEALRQAQATNAFLSTAPRFVVEALGMVMIAGLALLLSSRPNGLVGALPVLGALALGAQRILPLLQQVYFGWTAYLSAGQLLRDLLGILRLPRLEDGVATEPIPFAREIRLQHTSYTYPGALEPVVKDLNLVIQKGSRIGVVGRTGSGKSTLVDLIMGLLTPQKGEILIDGVPLTNSNQLAWQAHIAHVPQAIFLTDGSVAENIAFGVPCDEIEMTRVQQAAAKAAIADFIDTLPRGYDTLVGERGIRLSGGQRQRIGIARALYKQADVLVFDEATSALDGETERQVMLSIDALDRNLTVIIIAHRLSTVQDCDQTITLSRASAEPESAESNG